MPNWLGVLLNTLLFEIQWVLCVMSGLSVTWCQNYWAALVLLIVPCWRKSWIYLALVLGLTLIGIVSDALLIRQHVIHYTDGHIPFWLMALWLCFSCWFANASWLHHNYRLAPVFFAIGGAGSYYIAHHMGALMIEPPMMKHVLIIGLDWGLLGLIFVTCQFKARL